MKCATSILLLILLTFGPYVGYAQGVVTIAGGTFGDGKLATTVPTYSPIDVAVDSKGNIYFMESPPYGEGAEYENLRRIDKSTNKIWTIAGARPRPGVMPNTGNGTVGYEGPASGKFVRFKGVRCIALDKDDNIYLADYGNLSIRKIDAVTGYISSLPFNIYATALAFDNDGNLYIAEGPLVWKHDFKNPGVELVAGGKLVYNPFYGYVTNVGYTGDGNVATDAQLGSPTALAFDKAGNLLIADGQYGVIRKVDKETNIITTFAALGNLESMHIDEQNNIYVSLHDQLFNQMIKKIDYETKVITTIAGNASGDFLGEGVPATSVQLGLPKGICMDSNGDILFADANLNVVRKVDMKTGLISTFAGTGERHFFGENIPATEALLSSPADICLDASGNLYVADMVNVAVRRVDKETNIITTTAGRGSEPHTDGIDPREMALLRVKGVAVDAQGQLFIADNNRIFKIDNETHLTETILDGHYPSKMVFDKSGDLYFVNNQSFYEGPFLSVKKYTTATGEITTIAGSRTQGTFYQGMPATSMRFEYLIDDVAIDKDGNVLVQSNRWIYKIDKDSKELTNIMTGITSMFVTDDGTVYVAVSDLNHDYTEFISAVRILADDGGLTTVYDRLTVPITNLNVDKLGNIYAIVSSQAGSSVYGSEDRIIRIDGRKSQVISFAPTDVINGSGHKFNAVASSGLPVKYEVADASLLTIDDEEIAQVKTTGSTFVIAYQDGDASFAPATPVVQYITSIPLITSITDSENTFGISDLYPNPSTGVFHTFVNQTSALLFTAYNSTGQPLTSGKIVPQDGSVIIDLSDLDKGFYLIKLQSDQNAILHRVIIH